MAVGVAAEVKSKLSVLEIVGEQVELRKAGTTYKGLCPFHGEKTPSFVVTPARESWHCFGCGEGGDIFSFVMRRESLSFPEALKRLATRAGIEVDERTSREDARKARLREVLEQAIAFYHVVLTQSKTGAPALEYLHGRGFTDATIERFQLGWAPGGWDQMIKMLQSRRNVAVAELADPAAGRVLDVDPRFHPADRIAARDALISMITGLVGKPLRSLEYIAKLGAAARREGS